MPRRHASTAMPPDDPRPPLVPALHRLLAALPAALPPLAHVDAGALLLVLGQARGPARASIRALGAGAHPVEVRIDGRRRHHEISLRPLWFRAATLERRLEALVHELWHIDPAQPTALASGRRHRADRQARQRRELNALVRGALDRLDPLLLAPLGHDGEVLMPAWLERPVLTGEPGHRRRYTSKDLYLQPVRLITPAAGRSVWW